MATAPRDQNEALRSALGRLPMAIVIVDEHRMLQPFNRKAERLFDSEALRGDLLESYHTHPIARLIRSIDRAGGPEFSPNQTLAFPSGNRYHVNVSRASEKGCERWLLLIVEPAPADAAIEEDVILDKWALTPREREVAMHLLRGSSSDDICRAVTIASNTLRTHVRRILEKTGMHSRAEFVAKALGRQKTSDQ
jgi:DNA-binding CsgD family transcriptional regulator